jgi:hypothetical protein
MMARVDPRLAFLACASARLTLVEEGLLSIDEAMSPDFIEWFRSVAQITCHCEREIMDRMDAVHREMRERQLRAWRWRCRP